LLDLIGASWMSQVINVAAKLRIADILADSALPVNTIAAQSECHPASLHRLMRALASLGLCDEPEDGCFALTPLGALLRTDAPRSVRSWAIYWGTYHWPVWGNLLHSVRTGGSARELATGQQGYAYIESDPEAAALFNQAMVEVTRLLAADVVRVYDFSGAGHVVDVGGGYGELLTAILCANPGIRGTLFDLPHAIAGAAALVNDAGVAPRCTLVTGSFFDGVPEGGDIYLLKSILHNWDDARAAEILVSCRRAMVKGVRLVLVERIMPARIHNAAADRGVVRADLNMLVGLGGRERTAAEFATLLAESRFEVRAFLPAAVDFNVIEAVAV
jgi:hypothetical protein